LDLAEVHHSTTEASEVAVIRFANLMIILSGSYLSMRLQEFARHPFRT